MMFADLCQCIMYVPTLVMLVLILMVESSHLQYQHINGSQRLDF